MDRRAAIVFTVSGRNLALPLPDVARVLPVPTLAMPVGAPAYLEGFFDLGGRDVAVLRADRLLNLGDHATGIYAPLLLLRSSDGVALHVTAIRGLAKAPDIREVGKDETFNACVVGRFAHEGASVYLLAADAILLAEERARVAFHRAERARRLAATEEIRRAG